MDRAPVLRQSPFIDLRRTREVTWGQPRVRLELTFSEFVGGRRRDPALRVVEA